MAKEKIENKDWEYALFLDGEEYELVIPLSDPQPGFDVIHHLTKSEIKKYQQEGMESLKDRIKDMNSHYRNYKLNSWR